MEMRAKAEEDADYASRITIRQLKTYFMAERFFQKVYTDAKFAEVQTECNGVMYCNGREQNKVSENSFEHVIEDRVRSFTISKNGPIYSRTAPKKRCYKVKFDISSNEVTCECKMFVTKGILCRHCIRVYDLHNVATVPDQYVLRRWRKEFKRKHAMVRVAYHDPSKIIEVKRYDNMMVAFDKVTLRAMDHDRGNEIVMELIGFMDSRLNVLGTSVAVLSSASVGERGPNSELETVNNISAAADHVDDSSSLGADHGTQATQESGVGGIGDPPPKPIPLSSKGGHKAKSRRLEPHFAPGSSCGKGGKNKKGVPKQQSQPPDPKGSKGQRAPKAPRQGKKKSTEDFVMPPPGLVIPPPPLMPPPDFSLQFSLHEPTEHLLQDTSQTENGERLNQSALDDISASILPIDPTQ